MDELLALDQALFASVNHADLGVLLAVFFRAVSLMGSWPGTVIILVHLVWLHQSGQRRAAWVLAATLICSALVNGGIKVAVERPRPLMAAEARVAAPDGPALSVAPAWGEVVTVGEVRLRTDPLRRRSFPSGHAQHAFAWCVSLALLHRRGAVAFVALAVAVALSRVYLGVHYPLDVTVGAMLGAAFAWLGSIVRGRLEGDGREPEVTA